MYHLLLPQSAVGSCIDSITTYINEWISFRLTSNAHRLICLKVASLTVCIAVSFL
jgi:hypothetical protein